MMDDVTWQIAPNEGLLPVRFGDTPDAVAALPGMPAVERSVPQFGGGVTEQRGPLVPSIGYTEGAVTYIAAVADVPRVRFGELDVFAAPPNEVLAALEEANGAPPGLTFDTLEFVALNVSCTGYYFPREDRLFDRERDDQDDRVMILRAPGTRVVVPGVDPVPISFL